MKERFRGAVLVLDEASMVSTDQVRFLLQHARELDIARLVLVGDRSQLRAVEAGQPFRLLQQAGMTTAVMEDIRRQRNPDLRKAVNAVLAGDPGEAVELLGGSVHEEAPFEELAEKADEAWLEADPGLRDALGGPVRAELEKPLFRLETDGGPCLPDFLLSVIRPGGRGHMPGQSGPAAPTAATTPATSCATSSRSWGSTTTNTRAARPTCIPAWEPSGACSAWRRRSSTPSTTPCAASARGSVPKSAVTSCADGNGVSLRGTWGGAPWIRCPGKGRAHKRALATIICTF